MSLLKYPENSSCSELEVELGLFFKFFEIAGLQYFSLKDLNIRTLNKRPSMCRLFQMLIFTFALSFLWILAALNSFDSIKSPSPRNVVLFAVEKLIGFGVNLLLCIGMIQSFFMTKSHKIIVLEFQESLKFVEKEFGEKVNVKKFRRRAQKKLLFMFVFYFGIHAVVSFLSDDKNVPLSGKLIVAIPIIASISTFFRVNFLVDLINFQLKFLMRIIDKIFENHPIKIIENLDYHSSSKSFNEDLKKLNALRKVYNLIKKNSELLNKCLGLTVLVQVSVSAICLTMGGYNTYLSTLGYKNDTKYEG